MHALAVETAPDNRHALADDRDVRMVGTLVWQLKDVALRAAVRR